MRFTRTRGATSGHPRLGRSRRLLATTGLVAGAAAVVAAAPEAAAQIDVITRASVDSTGIQANQRSGSDGCAISADGRFVAFESSAWNLVPGDLNQTSDIFVHDRRTGATVRVSVSSAGTEADDVSFFPALSADGRFVVFASRAANLVDDDTNGMADVFVRDRDPDGNGVFDEDNGVTSCVSVDSNGVQGDLGSSGPSISADGRFVAFDSSAANLVAGDANGATDVFVHDRATGATIRASLSSEGSEGDHYSQSAQISANGRFVAFDSESDNLVPNDVNGFRDVFLRDLVDDVTELVSVDSASLQGNSSSGGPVISADGRIVAFTTNATNLVAPDTNGDVDVLVRDRIAGTTTRANADSSGIQGNYGAVYTAISGNGRFVAFASDAENLVANDTNGKGDEFIHDVVTGETFAVSVNPAGAVADSASFGDSALSFDGRSVVFSSSATDLVAGDTNGYTDVFVDDRSAHATWNSYGDGHAGTLGIPTLAPGWRPVLGSRLTVDVGNSSPDYTVGAMFIGFEQTAIRSSWGGDLLVGLSPWGANLFGDLPNDESLIGFSIDLQAIEVDAGAAKGMSFTQGLELLLGR
jgi:Tol biopolymer transport system component